MLELFGLIFFGLVVYTFLVIVPTVVENFTCEEFRASYFAHLAQRCVNSYGK